MNLVNFLRFRLPTAISEGYRSTDQGIFRHHEPCRIISTAVLFWSEMIGTRTVRQGKQPKTAGSTDKASNESSDGP